MHSSLTEANVVPLQFREAIYYLLCCYRWRTVHQCLGHTLLEVGNIFCFLKSKVLIKFPFQRLSLYDPFPPSLSSQHSTDLLTRVIHFLQARAIISKPQFQPFFFFYHCFYRRKSRVGVSEWHSRKGEQSWEDCCLQSGSNVGGEERVQENPTTSLIFLHVNSGIWDKQTVVGPSERCLIPCSGSGQPY